MRILFLAIAMSFVFMATPVQAGIFTMDFANSTYDLGNDEYIGLSDQYSGFGLSFSNISRYHGDFDPYDGFGICERPLVHVVIPAIVIIDPNNPPPPPPPHGRIYFDDATDFVEFDYFESARSYTFTMIARDANGSIVGTFSGINDGFGRIDAVGIKSIEFQGYAFAGLSSLTYHRDELPAIPEPKTALLFGLGIAGIALAGKSFR